jgi:hypothetical protein
MDAVELERLKREVTDLELERVRQTLLRLHGLGPNPQGLDSEEAAVYALWADDRSARSGSAASAGSASDSSRDCASRAAGSPRWSARSVRLGCPSNSPGSP